MEPEMYIPPPKINRSRPLRVLFIPLEFKTWENASHFPYSGNYGFEEGFAANGMEYLTIPAIYETTSDQRTSWLNYARELCTGKNFDQVWIEIVHSKIDGNFLDWLATLAPIRIGFIWESLEMEPHELTNNPEGARRRRENLEKHLSYVTHVVAIDEKDIAHYNAQGPVPAKWLWEAGIMPKRFIYNEPPSAEHNYAVFLGALYGERKNWLEHGELQGLLVRPERSPEYETDLPRLFNELNAAAERYLNSAQTIDDSFFPKYMDTLRLIRQRSFALWLNGLRAFAAVVNLPQFGKCYASRVIEGMAAGRPVISWEIPDRPRTRSLFEDGKEIFLYKNDNPGQLAEHIRRILHEPDFARRIAANARRKLQDSLTTEKLVNQILVWVEGKGVNARSRFKNREPQKAKGISLLNASSDANCLSQLRAAGLWDDGRPLRLHLGCGEQYFDGYINIDYPPSKHNIMQVKADVFANLLELDFPRASVDEIRLHHVFEHFSRVTALAMLIKWHEWLKVGGKLHIETPDLIGSAKTLLSSSSWKTKMALFGILTGDQAAAWAYHIDHWFPERFEHTLQRLGFDPVQTRSWSWPHEPYLANVEAMAIKSRNISTEEQLSNAEILLWESTVSPSEKPTYAVWMNQLKAALYGHVSMPAISMAKGAKEIVLSVGQTKERGKPVFINDWIREGDLVFDVGANLGAKTDVYLQKGASIVCFEPQPECARALREKYYGNPRVSIEERGLADKPGTMRLSICTEAHTISTFSDQWKTGRFGEYSWDKEVTVEVSTLDEMIERYGCPKYSKIDVEGFEFEVISGLTRKTPYLSFEFTIEFLENARKCVHHLERLGYQYFNVALGESPELVFPHWGCAEDLFHYIEQLDNKLLWGDIFVSSDSALSNGFTTGEAVGHTKQIEMAAISMGQSILSHNASRIPLPEIHDFNQINRDVWVKAKAATVPSGSRVLDIGAGTCPYRPLFAHCDYKAHDFKKYTGVKLGGGSEYGEIDYISDITDIPLPDSSFDVVLCTEVLEHVPEPIEALKEIARILRPGGRMLLTAPLGSGLHQLPYHFYGGFTPEWYKFIAQKLAFEVVEITPNGGFFRLLAQECARVLWTMPQHQHLHGSNVEFIRQLFGEWIPRYLFALDGRCFIDQFTVGYHIEMMKPSRRSLPVSIPEEQKLNQTSSPKSLNTKINGIIFSKDRPLQLDGTLRSFLLHCKDPEFVRLKVLYTTSSPVQETLYQRLIREHPAVKFVKEQNFKRDLLTLLEGPEMILFLVDDAIFIKDFSLMDVIDSLKRHSSALGFSLRLGRNTTYCYSLDKPQHLPAFQHLSPRILKYNWTTEEYDFGYPLEVSSSVYRAKEMQPLLARLPFSNPNTLEDLMDKHKNAFRESNPFLLCYEQSVTFCAPMNKVQTVASANRASGKVEYSAR